MCVEITPCDEGLDTGPTMEDANDQNSSSMILQLYCDEDPFVSTPPPPSPDTTTSTSPANHVLGQPLDEQQLDELFMDYRSRERSYEPGRDHYYLEHLRTSSAVSAARSTAVRYIISVFSRLGLAVATVFNAVNYLDRFLSMHCHVKWEVWMVELVSIACLSLACKLDEVNIPSLHDLQIEELLSHSFRPATIREMELQLLKALQWRLACVTPCSFLELFLCCAPWNTTAVASHAAHLLLVRSLLDPSLLRFDASTVATSALRCVAQDHEDHDALPSVLDHLIHPLRNTEECLMAMRAIDESLNYSDLKYTNHWSPVSVIPFPTDGTNDTTSIINRRRLFGDYSPGGRTEDTPKVRELK